MMRMHHTIIGLPRSGKTTFLAAIWHMIDASEVPTKLTLDRLVGDHHHLNAIVAAWQRCDEVPRTSTAAEVSVSIQVREVDANRQAVLSFPDLSGESFDQQVVLRSCRRVYVEGFEIDGGILLFVMADRSQDDLTVIDLAQVLTGDPSADIPGDLRDWAPDLIPEQVRLVELLQFLQRPPFRRARRRLAVVISAWDVVPAPRPSPEDWLGREMPLLYQFLRSNQATFDFRVYGVSAQGGDVRGEGRDDLLRKTPSERVVCVGPDAQPHDLTSPVLWLMSEG